MSVILNCRKQVGNKNSIKSKKTVTNKCYGFCTEDGT